jgi:hypothetical protein
MGTSGARSSAASRRSTVPTAVSASPPSPAYDSEARAGRAFPPLVSGRDGVVARDEHARRIDAEMLQHCRPGPPLTQGDQVGARENASRQRPKRGFLQWAETLGNEDGGDASPLGAAQERERRPRLVGERVGDVAAAGGDEDRGSIQRLQRGSGGARLPRLLSFAAQGERVEPFGRTAAHPALPTRDPRRNRPGQSVSTGKVSEAR